MMLEHEKYHTNMTLQSCHGLLLETTPINPTFLVDDLIELKQTKKKPCTSNTFAHRRHIIPLIHRTFFHAACWKPAVGTYNTHGFSHDGVVLSQISARDAYSGQVDATIAFWGCFNFFSSERFSFTWRVSTSTSYLRTTPAARTSFAVSAPTWYWVENGAFRKYPAMWERWWLRWCIKKYIKNNVLYCTFFFFFLQRNVSWERKHRERDTSQAAPLKPQSAAQ